MKLLAIVGTNADFSFNRLLCQFIAKRFGDKAEIEVAEIGDLPAFYKEGQADARVAAWREKVDQADGLIIATPEYDHAIPAALKSALEWLGSHAGSKVMAYK
ncbi:NAD(P)H-dependent oxidoreductase, partial [Lactobacillus delbrueckii]